MADDGMQASEKEEKNRQEELLTEAKNYFEAYKKQILEEKKEGGKALYLDFQSISEFSKQLADEILENPEETQKIIEQAMEQSPLIESARIRFQNLPESQVIKIRELRARHLEKMISIEGIIRQASDVRPQVVNAKFECPSCGTIISVLQKDKKFTHPSKCSCGRKGDFTVVSKEMVDTQRLVLEESPESLVGGEQPKRLNVFVKEDLAEPHMEERTTPGSRANIVGVLKEVPVPLPTGGLSTKFELAVEANNSIPLEEAFEELEISDEDEKEILELSQDPQVFDKLRDSMAPSIWGHSNVKKSLILQLFGGVHKKMSDGSKTRGDIHILLIGDPGVAKSVILSFMSNIAPKGRYLVGKSASGAGLTASVVKDDYLKGWSLEAGAMVLANKGLVCVDELEKMDSYERSTMHEAMEQQTVTVSKANIQATLNAQTSVLAAANPKFGRFDPYQAVSQQIDLPPTLINRFDIIFVLRDLPDKDQDAYVAKHVLKEHEKGGDANSIIPPETIKRFVAYAKQKVQPYLSEEASGELKNFYIELRNSPVSSESGQRPIPISARQLQALIRMSESAARIRLSDTVTKQDTDMAIEIMKFYLAQVGYDYESQTFDIDRVSSKFTHSQRNKIFTVKETIQALSQKLGKEIPMEEIHKDLADKMSENEIDESIEKLITSNEIYRPKHGYIGVF
ncbi:MAG: minichromosome maintenance protein MCM [Candidatus Pacearchaeota archaeon]